MSIAMSELLRMEELVRIIDVYNDKVDDTLKELLASFPIIDRAPAGLPLMEDVIRDYENGVNYTDGDTIVVSARLGDLYSSPYYNRILELRYGNHKLHLTKRGGFAFSSADTLSGYYRPKQKKTAVTKGNNRTSMLYAVTLDPNMRIAMSLKLHPRDISAEEIIRIESNDHNVDANYRTNQSGDHRFKSAYYAREDWAQQLYDFAKPFSIGIAGTLPEANFHCPSSSYLAKSRKEAGDEYTKRYLKAFTENNCSKEIGGSCTVAGAMFLKYFANYIAKIDELNNCDSFAECLRYYFKDWGRIASQIYPKARNVTQEDITGATTDYKKWEPAVARFVCLYNNYCERLTIPGNQETAIPFKGSASSSWVRFLSDANSLIRPQLQNIAEQKFF